MHKHSASGQRPLYVCQVDFEKAFDKVPRWALWQRLAERGVRGQMMDVLKRCYEKVSLRVKVNGKLSNPFVSHQGVKQGCPKSTDLFGIFIEALAEYIDAWDQHEATDRTWKHEAPTIGGKLVTCLLYADDLTLCALSIHRMQFLLNRLYEFCEAFGMRVNIAKCEIMVFAANAVHRQTHAVYATALRYPYPGDVSIPVKGRARYLGLYYGPSTTFDSCYQELIAAGKRAAYGLIAALDRQGCSAPDVMHTCFDVQVRSVLSYGVEVWGPDALSSLFEGTNYGGYDRTTELALRSKWRKAKSWFEKALTDPMVALQTSFLARAAGVRRPAYRLLYAEFGAYPMHHHWARMVFGFWNRIIKQKKSLAHTFVQDAIETAYAGSFEGMCWVSKIYRVCKHLGYDWLEKAPRGEDGESALCEWLLDTELPTAELLEELASKLMQEWRAESMQNDPRTFPESGGRRGNAGMPGVKMCRYTQWMGVPQLDGAVSTGRLEHMATYVTHKHLLALIRFRLGCWDIEVNRPMEGQRYRARGERVCRFCGSGVEDERHVLLECSKYASLREAAGITGSDTKAVMLQTPVHKLAAFLYAISTLRASVLHRT